jgi:hypothetical protein
MVYFKHNIPIWVNLEGLGMENVGMFYGHLEYIIAICYILGPFGNLVEKLVCFPRVGIM